MRAVCDFYKPSAAKTGMLFDAETAAAVAEFFAARPEIRLAVDPVLVSTSGSRLLEDGAVEILENSLIPLAEVFTPNLDEGALLLGADKIENVADAARALYEKYGVPVLLKGGHLKGGAVTDVLFDESGPLEMSSARIYGVDTHGSGCTLSAAIAANFAKGLGLRDACPRGEGIPASRNVRPAESRRKKLHKPLPAKMSPGDSYSHDGHRQRLRERFARGGIPALSDYEVIELMLTLCIPRIDVKPIAKDLVKEFGNLRGILDADRAKLMKVRGIGGSAAACVGFIKSLITLYHREELEIPQVEIPTIDKLIKYFKSKISAEPREVVEMVCLDSNLKIVPEGDVRICEGSVNNANADIRKIIETAIRLGAASIAIAHNHPGGDPRPSFDDIRFTKKLSDACRPINLSLIEHIIVGRNSCYSFRRSGEFDVLYDESIPPPRRKASAEDRARGRNVAEGGKAVK